MEVLCEWAASMPITNPSFQGLIILIVVVGIWIFKVRVPPPE